MMLITGGISALENLNSQEGQARHFAQNRITMEDDQLLFLAFFSCINKFKILKIFLTVFVRSVVVIFVL
jgi:hypothetical protein